MSRYFFSHARHALAKGLEISEIDIGGYILVPDYICSIVPDTILQCGYKVIYYKIRTTLEPDWNSINNLIDESIKAIVMVHYFGFPQDVNQFQSICRQHNLMLIEDNAHGFESSFLNKKLGSFGDFSFTSIRKSIGTFSGAELVINNKTLSSPSIEKYERKKISILMILYRHFSNVNFLRKLNLRIFKKNHRYENLNSEDEAHTNIKLIDFLSEKRILSYSKDSHKRDAYFLWLSFFKNDDSVRPIFPKLEEGVEPLAFPVIVRSLNDRLYWLNWGNINGYNVLGWPTLPKEIIDSNSSAFELRKSLLLFPVDKRTDLKHLMKLLKI